jgi:hypothetical protein
VVRSVAVVGCAGCLMGPEASVAGKRVEHKTVNVLQPQPSGVAQANVQQCASPRQSGVQPSARPEG